MIQRPYILLALLIPVLVTIAFFVAPELQRKAGIVPPATVYNRSEVTSGIEKPCSNEHPDWRPAQVIDGVTIDVAPSCEPDNPY
ncbi:MAG: copper oxidase, partial [Methylococcaceae bacterium]|nr:copper oxidase [Methylococcaceae bacterium]